MSKRASFPLQWPNGWPRTPQGKRENGRFKVSFRTAYDGVLAEIERMRGVHGTVTSDMPLKSNGDPYANGRASDPGVAAYWIVTRVGQKPIERVMVCDRYYSIVDNMRAVQLSIKALRDLARWGTHDMVERAFAGFAALPSAIVTPLPWWEVLGIDAQRARSPIGLGPLIDAQYRSLARERHPDVGGTHELFVALTEAYDQAQAFLREHA